MFLNQSDIYEGHEVGHIYLVLQSERCFEVYLTCPTCQTVSGVVTNMVFFLVKFLYGLFQLFTPYILYFDAEKCKAELSYFYPFNSTPANCVTYEHYSATQGKFYGNLGFVMEQVP